MTDAEVDAHLQRVRNDILGGGFTQPASSGTDTTKCKSIFAYAQ
jgi:hypothetical protein